MNEYNIIERINSTINSAITELSDSELLNELKDAFAQIPQKMNEPMQLAIVGKISSSKSTLVNAILGQGEVVRTGEMEETWNVSWLKYGDPSGNIIVHYKDGKTENISRNNWNTWANRERNENEKLKNIVSYLEVTYNHEILKTINIIDTPGLDSFYGTDSQNTLDFLHKVRPDAVIMLFSKSINADTLGVIEDFRQGVGAGLSPLNSMGVMSKIDNIWASDPDLDPLKEAQKISKRLMGLEIVKNTLFNIYPVSALVALSASTLSEEDFNKIRRLTEIDDNAWDDMMMSEARFVKDRNDFPLSVLELEYLRDTYGRYGIFIIVEAIKNGEVNDIDEAKQILKKQSGFDDFIDTVRSHFGQRATLIKSYSSIFTLSNLCRKTYDALDRNKENPSSAMAFVKVDRVIKNVDELIRTLTIEFSIVGIMKDIYDGKLDVEETELEEFRRASGEFGHSCIARLGLIDADNGASLNNFDLVREVIEKIKYWTILYNVEGATSPSKGRFYKLMISLYNQMLKDVKSAIYKYESSSNFLFGR